MTRLWCALVGHDPEPVVSDWTGNLAWWDCRRRCGWQLRTTLDPDAWPPATRAAAVVVLLVPLVMAAIVLLMMAAGIAAPAPS